jgi:acetylornithine/succinyldiaminopimelate/putrescine aminotransferase
VDFQGIKTYESKKLEDLLKSLTGLEKTVIFSEKAFALQFLVNILKENAQKTNRKKIILCSLNKKEFPLPDSLSGEYVYLNSESQIRTFFTKSVSAVIVRLAEIKDFIITANQDYLKLVKNYCSKNNSLLIYDACDISPLRLNTGIFGFNEENSPDILIASKGLSGGIPCYIVLCKENHINIQGGSNKSGCSNAVYSGILDLLGDHENLLSKVKENSCYIQQKFEQMSETHITLADFYAYGMIFLLVIEISARDFVKEAFTRGLIMKELGENTVLLTPPYTIDKSEIDYFMGIIDEIFDKLGNFDRLIPKN